VIIDEPGVEPVVDYIRDAELEKRFRYHATDVVAAG